AGGNPESAARRLSPAAARGAAHQRAFRRPLRRLARHSEPPPRLVCAGGRPAVERDGPRGHGTSRATPGPAGRPLPSHARPGAALLPALRRRALRIDRQGVWSQLGRLSADRHGPRRRGRLARPEARRCPHHRARRGLVRRVRHAARSGALERRAAGAAARRHGTGAGPAERAVQEWPAMTDNVLIVDDSLTVRMDLTEAFEAAGFAVLPCGTVAEALAVLARTEIAVAVLDVLLPDGNGMDLLQ